MTPATPIVYPLNAPGLYRGVPADIYHGILTDTPSLSSSGAVTILEDCPAKFWWNGPLNPAFIREEAQTFDIGTAAHLALLEPARWAEAVVVVDADDFRTKAAREARDAAYAEGKLPLLPKNVDDIRAMGNAARRHPEVAKVLAGAMFEVTLIWKDAATGVWLKCRPDILAHGGGILHDYKTCTNSRPLAFARHANEMSYHMRAAWYLDAVEAVTGERPDGYAFIAQEKTPPYLVSVLDLDEADIGYGRMMNRRAIDLFARCLETGQWPGRGGGRKTISLPGYARVQLEERRMNGEFGRLPKRDRSEKTPADLLRLSDISQAP